MYELLVGAGTGILAYAGGVATKPIQTFLEEKRQRKQLRKTLYNELSADFTQLWKARTFLQQCKDREVNVRLFVQGYITIDAFEYARKAPLLLNSIPEANHLKTLYSSLGMFIQHSTVETDRIELIAICDAQLTALRYRLSRHLMDADLFLQGIAPEFREVFDPMVIAEASPTQP